MNWYKWNRVLHRDLGYFFVGMIIIYAISGIALNHKGDFNPSYSIEHREIIYKELSIQTATRENIEKCLASIDSEIKYKSHYFPQTGIIKIFLKGGGTVMLDTRTHQGLLERHIKRPILFEFNFLHYNPGKLWTWFSDLFCLALIFLAISGLFILKGKRGIKGRGAWLTAAGIIAPLLFLIL